MPVDKKLRHLNFLKYIRKGQVTNVYELKDGAAELIEFIVDDGSRLAGVAISEAKIPKDSRIGAIVRDNNVINPKGDTVIEIGDKIVMCLLHDAIHKVEEFLSDNTQLI